MVILNEKQYAQKCIADNDIGEKPYRTLSILAKYYYFSCGYKKKQIRDLLIEFLARNYIEYTSSKRFWEESIDKIVSKVNKQTLYEISGVKITKSEIQKIQSLNNQLLEKLLFTMLCVAKYYHLKNEKNNGWVNLPDKDVIELANVNYLLKRAKSKFNLCINQLFVAGLLDLPLRCDNLNYRVTFISDDSDDEEELFVSDFRNLGYEYLLYCGENYIRCAKCGVLTKGTHNKRRKYCSKCAVYHSADYKWIICEDCGTEFKVKSKNNRSKRCADCQHIKQLKYQRNSMSKRRNMKLSS